MVTRRNLQVIVVGGGVAGLTMALSLHQAGIAVRVYEAVRGPRALGLGINLLPTAVRELSELGLSDELAQTGIATRELIFYNKFGQFISREKRGVSAGYKWPQYSIHRGYLHQLLLRAVCERIGREDFRRGLRFTEFEQNADRVIVRVCDRESGRSELDEADVLVGADGIHSAVRGQLHPREGEPRFAQQVLWRSAADAKPFFGRSRDGHCWLGPSADRGVSDGLRRRAWQATDQPGLPNGRLQRDLPTGGLEQAHYQRQSHLGVCQLAFPFLDIPALLDRATEIYEFPLVDRDPVARWSFARVTLIGDAAHPMWPFGSQAGSQAIVDARVLAGILTTTSDAVEALQLYDELRRPVMNDITLRNRRFGPEAAMDLVEERAPNGFVDIEDVISRQELEHITTSFSAAAGLDAEAVNGRSSFVLPSRFHDSVQRRRT